MSATHFVGDVGTVFRFTIQDQACAVVDLSTQTELKMFFKRPDGQSLERNAALFTDGTDGIITYTTVSGDLSLEGRWSVQGRVAIATGTFHTTVEHFEVRRNLT